MKVIFFSGDHYRHLYYFEQLLGYIEPVGVVVENRENMQPSIPDGLSEHEKELFFSHFQKRNAIEEEVFGKLSTDIYNKYNPIFVEESELSTDKVAEYVQKCTPDIVMIFGTGMILDPVLSILPKYSINLHLGLSPWYRGSATLFWPFYNLEPQYAGTTLHLITDKPDAGDIICHAVPTLKNGDSMHGVAAKAVVESSGLAIDVLKRLAKGDIDTHHQKSLGKLFLTSDFVPEHLKVIYDLFDDKIVDLYLDGKFNSRTPNLITLNDTHEVK